MRGDSVKNPEIWFSENESCVSMKDWEFQKKEKFIKSSLFTKKNKNYLETNFQQLVPIKIIPTQLKGGRPCVHGPGILGFHILGIFNLGSKEFLNLLSDCCEKMLHSLNLEPEKLSNPYDLWVNGNKIIGLGLKFNYLTRNQIISGCGGNICYQVDQDILDTIYPCGDKQGNGASSLHTLGITISRDEIIEKLIHQVTNTFSQHLVKE